MLSLFFICMLLLVCSSFTVARERVALVIGNAAYPSEALTNPVNDAKAVAKVLKQLHFDVMLVTDANGEQMQDAIESFGEKLHKGKEAVFYYSGHGVQYNGDNYLIPVDAMSRVLVPKHLPSFCRTLDYVVQLMVGKGSDMNIVMVDACRDNPFKRFKDIGAEKGLASLSRKADGTLISYATAPGEKALNGTGGNSPYASRLVELMMKPNLLVEMMFKELRSKVVSDTDGEQTPWMEASLGGEFYFNPELVNDDGRFVQIRGGEFTMGSPEGEVGHLNDQIRHQVKVSDFYMSKYELTVGEFRKFVEATRHSADLRSLSGAENHPVVYVTWNDAVAYCEWLSSNSGKKYRLPTEAEWEYACRAGTTTSFNTGSNLTTDQANYDGNYPYGGNAKGVYRQTTVPVDSFAPNALGLYNMHGNVWEWTDSLYDKSGSNRVLCGGSWNNNAENCRSANRNNDTPDNRNNNVGFRLVFVS